MLPVHNASFLKAKYLFSRQSRRSTSHTLEMEREKRNFPRKHKFKEGNTIFRSFQAVSNSFKHLKNAAVAKASGRAQ